VEIALLLVLGLVAGVLAGLFGVGGGILFVPTLVLVADLSQLEAEATSLLAIIPAAVAGTWQQRRYGNVRWRAALVVALAAIGGVEAGVRVAEALSDDALRRLFAALMIAVAVQLVIRAIRAEPERRET
jgi:uncharacterized membrane protein YfcA